jgi:hypothetical membrane protein
MMTSTTSPVHPASRIRITRRTSALAGIFGPVLFCLVFTVHGLLLGDEYDAVAEPVSALEAGTAGWLQQANFVWLGGCLTLFSVGVLRAMESARLARVSAGLLFLMPLGLLLAAALPLREDDAGVAYDPGGHFVAGVTFFLSSALALVVLSTRMRADRRWRSLSGYTLAAGCVAIGSFVLLGAFAIPDDAPLHDYAGLLQRATIMAVTFPCIVALALRLLRLPAQG